MWDDCYWERLNDLSGSLKGIIANDNTHGQFYVRVKDTDFAFSTNCEVVFLEKLPEHTGEYPKTVSQGGYLVGYDILPGIYKGNSDDCYWERLRDVSGSLNDIITNDNTNGQFYITIKKSDFAFTVGCDVEWTGQ